MSDEVRSSLDFPSFWFPAVVRAVEIDGSGTYRIAWETSQAPHSAFRVPTEHLVTGWFGNRVPPREDDEWQFYAMPKNAGMMTWTRSATA